MDATHESVTNKIDQMLKKEKCKQSQEDQKYLQSLPKEFIMFLKEKQIPIQELAVPIPRYIRTKPGSGLTQQEIVKSLDIKPIQIVKVDQEFYALAPEVKISNCKYYQQGLIYGMDYSSCIPARALEAQTDHKILQLCSAPGNKSMYLADSLENVQITGVQISVNRANVMKNLIKKYKLDKKIQVKVEDAVTFDTEIRFDRVLIDAECTHEGSIKHIKKFLPENKEQKNVKKNEVKANKNISRQQQKQFHINNSNHYTTEITKANQWSEQDFKQRFLDEKKLNNLASLQLGLIENGFRLLKNEGIMVYSTCSFDSSQNEDIVQQFLKKHDDAELLDCKKNLRCAFDFETTRKQECIRFRPSISRCGGMFISKIKRIEKKTDIQQD